MLHLPSSAIRAVRVSPSGIWTIAHRELALHVLGALGPLLLRGGGALCGSAPLLDAHLAYSKCRAVSFLASLSSQSVSSLTAVRSLDDRS